MTVDSSLTPQAPAVGCAVESTADERLRHLFRVFLKQGRIHPLYLPLLKYRAAEKR